MSFFLLGFCPGQGWCVSSVSDWQPIVVPTFVYLFSLSVGTYTLVARRVLLVRQWTAPMASSPRPPKTPLKIFKIQRLYYPHFLVKKYSHMRELCGLSKLKLASESFSL